jgi:hypothetical protein
MGGTMGGGGPDTCPRRTSGKDFTGLATPGEMDISIGSAHDDNRELLSFHNVTAR